MFSARLKNALFFLVIFPLIILIFQGILTFPLLPFQEIRNRLRKELTDCALLSCTQLFVIPWTVAHQAPLSIEFSRQKYWSGLPFPSPGDLPNPGIESQSPALQADSLPPEPPEKPEMAMLGRGNSRMMHTQLSGQVI